LILLPLFQASDIGVVLELSNIRTSITDFDETEKGVHTMDTLGGNQQNPKKMMSILWTPSEYNKIRKR